MKTLARRICDGKAPHLAKMPPKPPAKEKDKEPGHVERTAHNKNNRMGTPQGVPIIPLLFNAYMRETIIK
jgi:hypothetical protein